MTYTIFSSKTCVPCRQLKAYLGQRKVEYKDIDVNSDEGIRDDLHRKYGAMTVPVLVREDGEFMIGLNFQKLTNMLQSV